MLLITQYDILACLPIFTTVNESGTTINLLIFFCSWKCNSTSICKLYHTIHVRLYSKLSISPAPKYLIPITAAHFTYIPAKTKTGRDTENEHRFFYFLTCSFRFLICPTYITQTQIVIFGILCTASSETVPSIKTTTAVPLTEGKTHSRFPKYSSSAKWFIYVQM